MLVSAESFADVPAAAPLRSTGVPSAVSDTSSAGARGVLPDVAVRLESVTDEAAAASPVLVIFTVPDSGWPGMRCRTLSTVAPALSLSCEMMPAVTTLAGLDDVELKFAPVAAAMPPASRRANKATSRRAGLARQRTAARCMGDPFPREECDGRGTNGERPAEVLSTAGSAT